MEIAETIKEWKESHNFGFSQHLISHAILATKKEKRKKDLKT